MSATVNQIRGFLLVMPKPTKIVVTCGDGSEEEIDPKGRAYQKIAETIHALDPQHLRLFSEDGKLIRAKEYVTEDSRRSDAAAVPEALKADPQAAMLTHFANLIHRAYEHSTEVAFSRLVEITDRMNERSDNIEQRLERAERDNRKLIQEQIDDAFDRAREIAEGKQGDGGSFPENMMQAFMGGMNSDKPSQTQSNGKPNGKGGH